ncbi:MAG: Fis family transcriptional regulator [Patiriisocius sp.]|jgi:Fis family transcriptional regulator
MSDEYGIVGEPLEQEPVQAVASEPSLSAAVEAAVKNYMDAMESQKITDLYELVLSEIEAPLLASVMKRVGYNQSRASTMLGLNRGTLRKKLKKYGLV